MISQKNHPIVQNSQILLLNYLYFDYLQASRNITHLNSYIHSVLDELNSEKENEFLLVYLDFLYLQMQISAVVFVNPRQH